MVHWRSDGPNSYALRHDDEDVAATSNVERAGRRAWYWHTYVNGDEGFCETLEQAQAEAERSTLPKRLN